MRKKSRFTETEIGYAVKQVEDGVTVREVERKYGVSENWFDSLAEVRQSIEEWRMDYNKNRPHTSLANIVAEQFMARIMGL